MRSIPTFKLTEDEPSGGLQGVTPPMTYAEIVAIFGDPQYSYDRDREHAYKVSTQWNILFSDKTLACIYDYKMTSLYEPDLPSPLKFRRMKTNWHIGGDVEYHLGCIKSRASLLVLGTICLHWSFEKIMNVIEDLEDKPDPMLEFGITTCITAEKMREAARLAGKNITR